MSDTTGATILIVDDSPTMRSMIRIALTEGGCTVLEAANGHEGLACLQDHPVQMILTDVNMPQMDGITFVRTVRQDPRFSRTPILVLTTESAGDMKASGKAAGATGWIVKPFRPEDLREVVARVLHKQQAVSSQPSAVSHPLPLPSPLEGEGKGGGGDG
jgi:two-component system chemotaxis response regulator CheY